jgi:large subunit ribosomal protein L25
MAEIATIEAERRTGAGKGPARAARRAGLVPAVVYGDKREPLHISLPARALMRDMSRPGFFARQIDLKVDGKTERVLARDVQLDPVTEAPLHVDFLRVSAETEIRISVPVAFENQEDSPGLKRGGVLNVVRHDIEVECPVAAIPHSFTVDLTGLEIGDSVHISDITLPERVKLTVTDRDFTVATIASPTVIVEEKAAEEVEEGLVEGIEGVETVEGEAPPEREEEGGKPAKPKKGKS